MNVGGQVADGNTVEQAALIMFDSPTLRHQFGQKGMLIVGADNIAAFEEYLEFAGAIALEVDKLINVAPSIE